EGREDPAQLDRIEARYELVERIRIELLDAELPCFAAENEAREDVAWRADERALRGEHVLDDLRQLERRVLEAEQDRVRVLVEAGDRFARRIGESRLRRRGEDVEVRQHDRRAGFGRRDRVGELTEHVADDRSAALAL